MLIFKKEKKVLELIRQHMAYTDQCLKKAREVLETYLSGDIAAVQAMAVEVGELESLADSTKREIRDVLYSGAYLPDVRADLYRLIDRIDEIAGKADYTADFIVCQAPQIPEEYQAEFIEIYSISVACFYELTRAMKTFMKPKGKFEKLQERSNRVGQLESEVDEKENLVTERVFGSDLEYAHKLHLIAFLGLVSSIADITEYASDELMFAALKSAI
jgi:predicted phosphate transport protein (TIGR00153 family)